MMARLNVALLSLWLAFAPVLAQVGIGTQPNYAQLQPAPSSGGYTGPGDVISGALFAYSLRCWTNAYNGNMADIVDSATGNTTGTRLQCATGNVISSLVSGSACTFVTGNACSSLATTCATACKVVTLYDQSGNTNCSGPCDITNISNSNRPAFTQNCVGTTKPCMTWVRANSQILASGTNLAAAHAQPFSCTGVGKRTGSTTSENDIIVSGSAGGDTQVGFGSSANTALAYNGTTANVTSVADNTWHALNVLFNAASSNLNVDGSSNTVNAGNGFGGLEQNPAMGGPNFLDGTSVEGACWGTDVSASFSTLNSNQKTYWGY